ncbi:MAG: tetratricopeptide repeat protein [Okeania sp. SIO2F4]|uniref:tetratricopeptide repeat protein n=1 Tax=Okeania sp. SIO2F4 TaxID=2607790 RepID=UPI001429DCD6|nr:tetratricopeptide repeat protein [Okeania sp. SIO2F4]NES03053.1 tetratricopeptide repeat protein [Okeania sp. SIO2F4]
MKKSKERVSLAKISASVFTPCLVKLSQSSKVELNVQLVLEKKPTRQQQKLKTLTKYVQQYPSGWKKRLELADLLYESGNWELAVEEYHQVIERQPQLIQVGLKLGKLLQLMGRVTEAIKIYDKALPLSSNFATGHHIQGLIEVCRSHPDKAVKMFEKAASSEPENPSHWLALGRVQMELNNAEAALRAFEQILSIQPDDIVALIHSYDALLAVGHFQEAELRLSRAEELVPDDYSVLKRRLAYRCRMKLVLGEEGKQTKKMVNAVLKLAPHSADAHQLKAEYYRLRGESAKSVAILKKFTEEYPNNPNGRCYYTRCLSDIGKNQGVA